MFDHVRSFIFFSFPILYNIYMSDIIQLSQHISRWHWHSGSLANCIRLFIFCSWPELELQEFYSGLTSSMYHGWQEFLGTSFLSSAKFPLPFLFFLFPSFTLPFPSPFPRSCESFGQDVKPALGKTIRGKKMIMCGKTIWKGSGFLQTPNIMIPAQQLISGRRPILGSETSVVWGGWQMCSASQLHFGKKWKKWRLSVFDGVWQHRLSSCAKTLVIFGPFSPTA